LYRKVWCGKYDIIAPNQLKAIISKLAPRFAGYQQQDAQELLNFILNQMNDEYKSLHEKIKENADKKDRTREDKKDQDKNSPIENMFSGTFVLLYYLN
jgi:ubiquitin C-terminal hydrolase